jgi:tetratricopeptide (TPR) repeat protein
MGGFIHHHAFAETDSPAVDGVGEQPSSPEPKAVAEARVAMKKGDTEAAVRILQAAFESAEGAEKAELQKALAMIGPPELAGRAAEAALEKDPNDVLLLQRVARIALSRGKPKIALKHLGKVPELSRDDACWRLVAEAQRAASGNWVEPLLKVEQRTGPEARQLALALIERGRVHQKNKRSAQALRDLRRARQVDPDLPGAHLALGLYLLGQKKFEEARISLREAIKRDSAPAAPWLALGLVMDAQGKKDAARANYEQFLRLASSEGGHEDRIARVEARLKALQRD